MVSDLAGGSSIRQYHVLNDKCHILTKDTEYNVALWNVLSVSLLTTTNVIQKSHELIKFEL